MSTDILGALENQLLAFLQAGEVDRTALMRRCFGGHVSSSTLDLVLDRLLASTPPRVEVVEVARKDGQPGRRRTLYRLAAVSVGEVSELCEDRLLEPIFATSQAAFAPDTAMGDCPYCDGEGCRACDYGMSPRPWR